MEARQIVGEAAGFMGVQLQREFGASAEVVVQGVEASGPNRATAYIAVRSQPQRVRGMVARVELSGDLAVFERARLAPARAAEAEVAVMRTDMTWNPMIVGVPAGLSEADIAAYAEAVVRQQLDGEDAMDVVAVKCTYWRYVP